MGWFSGLHPVMQGFLATMFTYAVTVLGASLVFFIKRMNQKVMDVMMGFAAGVMIAASYWSLLEPAIAQAEEQGGNAALTAAAGFLLGGMFIMVSDIVLAKKQCSQARGNGWRRCVLLTTAVTLHNIPEGLAVGVAFGSAAMDGGTSLIGAVMLAVGIGIQNFPEGAAVSVRSHAPSKGRRRQMEKFSGGAVFRNCGTCSRGFWGLICNYRAVRFADRFVLFSGSYDFSGMFGTDSGIVSG